MADEPTKTPEPAAEVAAEEATAEEPSTAEEPIGASPIAAGEEEENKPTETAEGEEPPAEGTPAPPAESETVAEEAAPAPEEAVLAADEAAPAAEGEEVPAEAEGDAPVATEDEKPTDEEIIEGDENGETEVKEEDETAEKIDPVEGETPQEGDGQTSAVPPEEALESSTPAPPGSAPAEGEETQEPPAEPTEGDKKVEELPQSDTFADGEKPESPQPHVGEVLSREGSVHEQPLDNEHPLMTPPEALSPREPSHFGDDFAEGDMMDEEIMSPEQDREALVEMYHQSIAEREQLQQQNHQLQHKLAEYFRKKKSDEQRGEVDKNVADQEQRYLKYMSNLEELRAEDIDMRDIYASEIEELQERCQERQDEVDAHRSKFVEFKHQVALNSLNSRSGKPILPKDIDAYMTAENRKDQEVIQARLENIKLKNKLKKKEQQLKSKEELADGLHLIDFEQLKIENQTYNEKIEERNEELLKLRKKITNTVQVLTHLKEKLQFVQGENGLLKANLRGVESSVAQKRDVLTRTKQARDALRIDNHRLRQNCGLLGNEPLLRDFEDRKDEADALRERLEKLKMHHAELTLNTTSVRRKIEQIKAVEQN